MVEAHRTAFGSVQEVIDGDIVLGDILLFAKPEEFESIFVCNNKIPTEKCVGYM